MKPGVVVRVAAEAESSQKGLKRLMVLGLAVTAGFSVICWNVFNHMAERDAELARVNAYNVVSAIGADISRNVETYDLSLQAVVEGLELPNLYVLPPETRQLLLFDRAATAHGLGSILVLDENGTVSLDSRSETPAKTNYAYADFFTAHLKKSDLGLYVSRPVTMPDGERVIGVSRRLNTEFGDFAGVVVGVMKLAYFQDLFRRPSRYEQDALSLVRVDGTVLMRLPYDEALIGRNIGETDTFQRIKNTASGSFEAVAALDGTRRLYVFQHQAPLPFILTYGIATDRLHGEWFRRVGYLGAIVFVLCLTNFGLIYWLTTSLRRRNVAERALQKLVVTDTLTGLYNRRGLDQTVDVEWRRALRSGQPVSLLMIDADNFKTFNDRFGHQAGDAALASIGICIAESARRAGDCAARYGGEEFALLLPDTKLDDAYAVAERIRGAVTATREAQGSRPDKTPTISIGVAEMAPRKGLTAEELFKAADAALYMAKGQGRNRTVCSGLRAVRMAEKVA